MKDLSNPLVSPSKPQAVIGWMVRGESTYLYVDSPVEPHFVFINGHDKVVSIEPRYGSANAQAPVAPKAAVQKVKADVMAMLYRFEPSVNGRGHSAFQEARAKIAELIMSLAAHSASAQPAQNTYVDKHNPDGMHASRLPAAQPKESGHE